MRFVREKKRKKGKEKKEKMRDLIARMRIPRFVPSTASVITATSSSSSSNVHGICLLGSQFPCH